MVVASTLGHYGITWDGGLYLISGKHYARWMPDPTLYTIVNYWAFDHEYPPLTKILGGITEYLCHQKFSFQRPTGDKRIAFKGLKAFPAQPRFHVLLGMIAFSGNQPEEAIIHYREAIRMDRNSLDALYNLGLVYLETERPGRAIEYFQEALSLEEKPHLLFYLAMALEEKGDEKTDVKYYQRYLDKEKGADFLRQQAEKRLLSLKLNMQ